MCQCIILYYEYNKDVMDGTELYNLKINTTINGSQTDIQAGRFAHYERSYPEYLYHIPNLRDILDELQSRNVPLEGLDFGCGRGVAAEQINEHWTNISMHGIDLVRYPINNNKPHLPENKIMISSLGKANLPKGSYDLILAVGSLDTSYTLEEDGPRILDLIKPNGYAIIAFASVRKDYFMIPMIAKAEANGISKLEVVNKDNRPCYIFRREPQKDQMK